MFNRSGNHTSGHQCFAKTDLVCNQKAACAGRIFIKLLKSILNCPTLEPF
jgi:hypothetical protein